MEQLAHQKLKQIISCLNTQSDLTGTDIADVFWLALKQKESSSLNDIHHLTKIHHQKSSFFCFLLSISLEFEQLAISLLLLLTNLFILFLFLLENKLYKLALLFLNDSSIQPSNASTTPDNNIPISPPQDTVNKPDSSLKGKTLPIRHIDPPSLRKPLEFAKALRPLMQKIDSGSRTILDEIKTVEKTAKHGICFPVLTSQPEPLFDLALIIDENSSMVLWQHFIKDLQQLVEHYGIFREVSTWGLAVDNDDQKVTLVNRKNKKAKVKNPEEIIDPIGRKLIIIVSDCVGQRWFDGSLIKTLKNWTKYQPLALLQILPHSLWLRSGLKLGAAVKFTNSIMGNANRNLLMKELLIWKDFDLEKGSKIPAFTVEIESSETDEVNNWSVSNWSKFLMGKHDQTITGFIFPSESEFMPLAQLPQTKIAELNGEQRIERFRRISSPLGRKLAGLLMASPVITLPIVRIIQEKFLDESSSVHIAEVFLGGILKPLTEITPDINADSVIYDVAVEDIRTQLLNDAPFRDSEMIFWTISDYIERKLGKSLRECVASLVNKSEDATKDITLENVYARISRQILSNLGENYANFFEEISKLKVTVQGREEVLRFETSSNLRNSVINSNLYEEKSLKPPLSLSPPERLQLKFVSETVFVDKKGEIIRRQPVEAFYFEEALGERIKLNMMDIPAGEFIMGSPETEKDSYDYERPQHRVTVSQFYLSQTPITESQWQFVAGLPQEGKQLRQRPSNRGDNHPVTKVSWYDAVEFCARLSRYTGRNYRLPSEAEWEYACRAGTKTPFHFGETIRYDLACYNSKYVYRDEAKGKGQSGTTPVGNFYPNGFGLYDMHGNVLEWCGDSWHSNYQGAPDNSRVWDDNSDYHNDYLNNIKALLSSSNNSIMHVRRGGSWFFNPRYCRSAYRYYNNPGNNNYYGIGFRVAYVAIAFY